MNLLTYNGEPVQLIWQELPWLEPLYMDSFQHYDITLVHHFITRCWQLPVFSAAVYLLFCLFGPLLMQHRSPFALTRFAVAWNAIMAVLSAWGMLKIGVHFAYIMATEPFVSTLCTPPTRNWGAGVTGLWVQLMYFLRFAQLFDHVILILRKKALRPLHYIHHSSVLFVWFLLLREEVPFGSYLIVLNLMEHVPMYTYFALHEAKCLPSWFPGWIVTILQLVQMLAFVVLAGAAAMVKSAGTPCATSWIAVAVVAADGALFVCLFTHFICVRFLWPKQKRAKEAHCS
jgi:elongation of very long chain fatty acids protein 6